MRSTFAAPWGRGRAQEPRRHRGGELDRRTTGTEIAKQPMEPVHHPSALRDELVPAVGEQPEHPGVILRSHPTQGGGALGHPRHGLGVDPVGLPPMASVELASPCGQRGGDVEDDLAGGDELLGEQVAQPVGALDRPDPLGPPLGPSAKPSTCAPVDLDPKLGEDLPGLIEGHGGVRRLVGIDPNGDHGPLLPAGSNGGYRGGQPEFQEAVHASIEPRRRRSVTGQHAMSEPHRQVGKERESQPAIDLAPYGLALPGMLPSSKQVRSEYLLNGGRGR